MTNVRVAERSLHRDVKTKLSFTWPELGRDVKPHEAMSHSVFSLTNENFSSLLDKSGALSIDLRPVLLLTTKK